jgi:hypothetical protein
MDSGNGKLISDFCHLDSGGTLRLSEAERLTLIGGSELGKLFKRLEKNPLSLSFEELFLPLTEQKLDYFYNYYQEKNFFNNDFEKYKKPKGIFSPTIIPVHGLSDVGEIVDLQFQSAYESSCEIFDEVSKTIPENKTVYARYWRHKISNRPTIVCVHGWTMSDPRVQALAFLPGLYFRLGYDVVLFELPFHGRRLNAEFKDADVSLFPSANLALTNEAIFQTVSDLRQLKLILHALGVKTIGTLGISLGSYLSTIWSRLDNLAFSAQLLPFNSFANIAEYNATRINQKLSDECITKLKKILRTHELTTNLDSTDHSQMLFISSVDDSVIPSEEFEQLKLNFNKAQFLSVSGDHNVTASKDFIFDTISNFLFTTLNK